MMNTGFQKPPLAPKPRVIHSPKPGLSPATPQREALSVPSPATARKPKPVLAPKPGTHKLTTAVASKDQSPGPESPLSVGLLNSQNGLQQENKRPNWDYIIPICFCNKENCRCIKNETFSKVEKELKTITKNKSEQEKNSEQNVPENTTQKDSNVLNDNVLSNHKPFQEVLALYQNLNTVNPIYSPALTNSPSLPYKQSPVDVKSSVTSQSAPGQETEEEVFDTDQISSPSNAIPIPSAHRKPLPVPIPRKPRNTELSAQENLEEEIVYNEVNEVSSDLQSVPSSSVNIPASCRESTRSRIPKPTFAPPAPPPRNKPFLSVLGKSFSSEEVEEEDLGLDVHEMEISVDKEDNGTENLIENMEEPIYCSVDSPRNSFIQPPKEEVIDKVPPQKPQRRNNQMARSMELLDEKETPKHYDKREMVPSMETKEMIMRELPLPPDEKTKTATLSKRLSLSKAKSFSGADSNRPKKLRKNSFKMLLDLKLVVQKKFKARESQAQDNSDSEKEPREEDESPNVREEYKGARKSSCPLIGLEQSVDGDVFSPNKEPDQVYENNQLYEEIGDYMNINVGDDEVTSPMSWEDDWPSPMYNDDDDGIYEEQDPYMTLEKDKSPPLDIYDYPRKSFREELTEERPLDEDIMDNSTDEEEDEEDTSSISSKGDPEQTVESATLKRKKNKIQHIATEIMTSENVFVDVLKLLHVDFRNAVHEASRQSQKPVIEDRLLNQILYCLPQLYELNQDLLKELRQRVATWGENSKVADIFVKKGAYLKMYSTYIREFDKNVALLAEQTKKNTAFGTVVREFEASPLCANLALNHYLLKPVQRIPQYQLLLTDYLKNLTEDSSDYKDTQEALVIVKEVANHANDIMKQGDIFQKLIQVQCRLTGQHEIVQPGRIFLKEGALNKLSRRVMQPRMFFLFNDMLLYTTPGQSGQYKVKNKLSLARMRVSKPVLEAYQNELNIESVERSFILSASSATERDEWLKVISKAIDDFRKKKTSFIPGKADDDVDTGSGAPLGSKAPIWIPDSRVTMCMVCTFKFTTTWRRHHCRACGKVICDNCSSNNYPLEYLKYKFARVCQPCYVVLQKQQNDKAISHSVTNKSTFAFTRKHKKIPAYLKEVTANTVNSSMSGYLERIKGNKKQGKRQWFVIKDMILYTYAASEDVAALKSQPLLGFSVKSDSELQFRLLHKNTLMLRFKADDAQTAERWIEAFTEASKLYH